MTSKFRGKNNLQWLANAGEAIRNLDMQETTAVDPATNRLDNRLDNWRAVALEHPTEPHYDIIITN